MECRPSKRLTVSALKLATKRSPPGPKPTPMGSERPLAKVLRMLPLKYPDAPPATARMKMPAPEDVALFRVVPEIVSVLDYTKGFAHTDLVSCSGDGVPETHEGRGYVARVS